MQYVLICGKARVSNNSNNWDFVCVCVCVSAVPWLYSGHAKKGVLNQRQLQEVTAVTTHYLQEMGTLNSMFTYKTLSII